MSVEGKGFFTWKIPNCEGGDASAIASLARESDLTHMVLKVADGTMIYNGNWGDQKDYTTPVVSALRANGIKVWGWHYIYGDNPTSEANVAIQRIRQYNLDGYVLDVEKEYKLSGKRSAAKKFMTLLRAANPKLSLALSSYRYPSLHPQIPWKEFLEQCDVIMPQVYWMRAHNPGDQLDRTVREYQHLATSLPIIPTGAAFREYGWMPTEGEVLEFIHKAREMNLSGVNFWEWSDARSGTIPGVWETIKKFRWSEKDDPKDICVALIDAMNKHDIEKLISLYTLPAVHLTSLRTTQGFDGLRSWYTQLFNETMPNSAFKLGTYTGKGSTRHLTWTATSSKGVVHDGSDTLGLSHGKINFHYSFFKVTPQ